MKQGINFILHHAALLFVILAMAAGMFVIGCFGPLIAVYVRDSLGASTRTFGVRRGHDRPRNARRHQRSQHLRQKGQQHTARLLRPLRHLRRTPHPHAAPAHLVAILGNLIVGVSVAAIIVPAQTLFQQATPPELMGRVGSTFMSIIFGAQISGLVLSGILTQHIGVRQVFALCAAMLLVLMAAGKLWMEPKPARA